jgi:hypothetical protein
MTDTADSGVPVTRLYDALDGIDVSAFRARIGPAVLLRHRANAPPPARPTTDRVTLNTLEDTGTTNKTEFHLYPLKPDFEARAVFSVGRDPENDVVIGDDTVSRFHAFLRCDAGQFSVVDNFSSNGTQLNGQPVPTKAEGAPMPVPTGSTVVFGSVSLTFLNAEEFVAHLDVFVPAGRE